MSHQKKSNLLKIITIVGITIFLLQACSKKEEFLSDTGVCSHPWLLVGFDAESIGTTTGDIEIWREEKGIIQTGL